MIIGYAVIMDNGNGNFVGIWKNQATAELIRSKQPEYHNNIVVMMQSKELEKQEG